MWRRARLLFVPSTAGGTLTHQHMELVLWLLTAIPQHDEETIMVHVPLMAARILRGIVSCSDIEARS